MKTPPIFKILSILLLLVAVALGVVSYYFYNETIRINKEKEALRAQIIQRASDQIISQKKQKNEIADLFDSQAALNDDLALSQRDLIKSSQEYIRLIDRSIRFVEGQPQLFPNVSETEFLRQKNDLTQKIADLQRIAEENTTTKDRNAQRINQIYLDAGEDRNNTANEREGFR